MKRFPVILLFVGLLVGVSNATDLPYKLPDPGRRLFDVAKLSMTPSDRIEIVKAMVHFAADQLDPNDPHEAAIAGRLLSMAMRLDPNNQQALLTHTKMARGLKPQRVGGNASARQLTMFLIGKAKAMTESKADADRDLAAYLLDLTVLLEDPSDDVIVMIESLRRDGHFAQENWAPPVPERAMPPAAPGEDAGANQVANPQVATPPAMAAEYWFIREGNQVRPLTKGDFELVGNRLDVKFRQSSAKQWLIFGEHPFVGDFEVRFTLRTPCGLVFFLDSNAGSSNDSEASPERAKNGRYDIIIRRANNLLSVTSNDRPINIFALTDLTRPLRLAFKSSEHRISMENFQVVHATGLAGEGANGFVHGVTIDEYPDPTLVANGDRGPPLDQYIAEFGVDGRFRPASAERQIVVTSWVRIDKAGTYQFVADDNKLVVSGEHVVSAKSSTTAQGVTHVDAELTPGMIKLEWTKAPGKGMVVGTWILPGETRIEPIPAQRMYRTAAPIALADLVTKEPFGFAAHADSREGKRKVVDATRLRSFGDPSPTLRPLPIDFASVNDSDRKTLAAAIVTVLRNHLLPNSLIKNRERDIINSLRAAIFQMLPEDRDALILGWQLRHGEMPEPIDEATARANMDALIPLAKRWAASSTDAERLLAALAYRMRLAMSPDDLDALYNIERLRLDRYVVFWPVTSGSLQQDVSASDEGKNPINPDDWWVYTAISHGWGTHVMPLALADGGVVDGAVWIEGAHPYGRLINWRTPIVGDFRIQAEIRGAAGFGLMSGLDTPKPHVIAWVARGPYSSYEPITVTRTGDKITVLVNGKEVVADLDPAADPARPAYFAVGYGKDTGLNVAFATVRSFEAAMRPTNAGPADARRYGLIVDEYTSQLEPVNPKEEMTNRTFINGAPAIRQYGTFDADGKTALTELRNVCLRGKVEIRDAGMHHFRVKGGVIRVGDAVGDFKRGPNISELNVELKPGLVPIEIFKPQRTRDVELTWAPAGARDFGPIELDRLTFDASQLHVDHGTVASLIDPSLRLAVRYAEPQIDYAARDYSGLLPETQRNSAADALMRWVNHALEMQSDQDARVAAEAIGMALHLVPGHREATLTNALFVAQRRLEPREPLRDGGLKEIDTTLSDARDKLLAQNSDAARQAAGYLNDLIALIDPDDARAQALIAKAINERTQPDWTWAGPDRRPLQPAPRKIGPSVEVASPIQPGQDISKQQMTTVASTAANSTTAKLEVVAANLTIDGRVVDATEAVRDRAGRFGMAFPIEAHELTNEFVPPTAHATLSIQTRFDGHVDTQTFTLPDYVMILPQAPADLVRFSSEPGHAFRGITILEARYGYDRTWGDVTQSFIDRWRVELERATTSKTPEPIGVFVNQSISAGHSRAMSTKSRLVVTYMERGQLRQASAGEGEQLWLAPTPENAIALEPLPIESSATTIAASPDGRWLFVAHEAQDRVTIWDIAQSKIDATLDVPMPRSMRYFEGRLCVAQYDPGRIVVCDRRGDHWRVSNAYNVPNGHPFYLSAADENHAKNTIFVSATHGTGFRWLRFNTQAGAIAPLDVAADGALEISTDGLMAAVQTAPGPRDGKIITIDLPALTDSASPKLSPVFSQQLMPPCFAGVGSHWYIGQRLSVGGKLIPVADSFKRTVMPDATEPMAYTLGPENLGAISLGLPALTLADRSVRYPAMNVTESWRGDSLNNVYCGPIAVHRGGKLHVFVVGSVTKRVLHLVTEPFERPAEVAQQPGDEHVVRYPILGADWSVASTPKRDAMLISQGPRLTVTSPDGVKKLEDLVLPYRYMRVAQRGDQLICLGAARIDVVDRQTLKVVKHADLPDCRVMDMALNPALSRTYVALEVASVTGQAGVCAIYLFDESTGQLNPIEGAFGKYLAIDSTGQILYAVHDDLKITEIVAEGVGGGMARVSPVTSGDSVLFKYEVRGPRLNMVDHADCMGRVLNGLYLTHDDRYLVCAVLTGGFARIQTKLACFDPTKMTPHFSIVLQNAGYTPMRIDVHPTRDLAVALTELRTLKVIDLASGNTVKHDVEVPAGFSGFQAAFTPDGSHVVLRGQVTQVGPNEPDHLRVMPIKIEAVDAPVAVVPQPKPQTPHPTVTRDQISAIDRQPAAEVMTPAVIAERYKNAVVVIKTDDDSGTGCVVGQGLVLTCAHVVPRSGAAKVLYRLRTDDPNRDFREAKSKMVYLDDEADLALLEIKPDGLMATVAIGPAAPAGLGAAVTLISNPGAGDQILDHTLTTGVVSSSRRMIKNRPYVQTNAAMNPGSSGGPVFDEHGLVIGIAVMKTSLEGTGFAIPSGELRAFLDKCVQDGANQPKP
ncbi:MAG: trypsin-like serine protease [Planctomycetes bacterium]|nr:trypsin-like serine protease [Planctomycetota bacterium]